ncbi:hypothetical protein ACFWY5_41255 [Nonomuraea sp. NPDC059007]|uniref:hypothetical protein n=1 Tax=Nonomuraea sp. NPDC059007 TaxID=3346692 RepID=UPI00369D6014
MVRSRPPELPARRHPERRSSREELLASAAQDPERIRRVFRAFDHESAFLTGLRTLVDALARPGRD